MDCCSKNKNMKKCLREDNKIFTLPRKFSQKKCLTKPIKGFTMRASCAPYKFCKKSLKKGGKKIQHKTKKQQFLYNPNNPKKSFDVYINKNPADTINIKYKTLDDVKNTIKKLEKLYKNKYYSHKRIWQVGMIMKVRLEAMLKHKNTLYKNAKNVKQRYILSKKYFEFLGKRSKVLSFNKRKSMIFKY
tara:strand:- start:5203 stop:5766 length:564 start_codon:yes stop_codon:yes gene_type:complete